MARRVGWHRSRVVHAENVVVVEASELALGRADALAKARAIVWEREGCPLDCVDAGQASPERAVPPLFDAAAEEGADWAVKVLPEHVTGSFQSRGVGYYTPFRVCGKAGAGSGLPSIALSRTGREGGLRAGRRAGETGDARHHGRSKGQGGRGQCPYTRAHDRACRFDQEQKQAHDDEKGEDGLAGVPESCGMMPLHGSDPTSLRHDLMI